jgi:hypothetical protein
MPHMVRGAKSGWPIAARETTPAIPGDEGAADTQGDSAHRSADIEGLGVAAQHHGNEFAVAG